MAKNDFIFVDESGDTGYKLGPDTGELLSSTHYILAALHVTDQSIRRINRHIAAFRFYTGFDRELKLPPEKNVFNRLMAPIKELADEGLDISASVVYLDKALYDGPYLKQGGPRGQRPIRFRNYILRRLMEFHMLNHPLLSPQYELVLDRIDLNPADIENLREYLRQNDNFQTPSFITHASSVYVEGLQVVHHIATGFKNVAEGGGTPGPLSFVSWRDVTSDGSVRAKQNVG